MEFVKGVLICIIWGLIQINVYEIGKVVFGKILGAEFILYLIGPIRIYKNSDKINIVCTKEKISLGGAIMKIKRGKARTIIFLLSGIIFQIISLVALGILCIEIGEIKMFFILLSVTLFCIVVNNIPAKNTPFSPGSMIFALCRDNESDKRQYETFYALNKIVSGDRFSEIDLTVFDRYKGDNSQINGHIEIFKYFRYLEMFD